MSILFVVAYLVIGLIIARATASYYTETNKKLDRKSKVKVGTRQPTFEEYSSLMKSKGYTFLSQDKQEYHKYKSKPHHQLADYRYNYNWSSNVEQKMTVYSLPVLWIPFALVFLIYKIFYYPAIGVSKASKYSFDFVLNKIDWIGKELANPRANVSRTESKE